MVLTVLGGCPFCQFVRTSSVTSAQFCVGPGGGGTVTRIPNFKYPPGGSGVLNVQCTGFVPTTVGHVHPAVLFGESMPR
jgi:hypothetical protein